MNLRRYDVYDCPQPRYSDYYHPQQQHHTGHRHAQLQNLHDDVYDYYANVRGWEGDPDLEDDLDNIYRQVKVKFGEGKLNENQDDSYYIDEIKRDLEELDDKEANEYLEELAKSILKLKR